MPLFGKKKKDQSPGDTQHPPPGMKQASAPVADPAPPQTTRPANGAAQHEGDESRLPPERKARTPRFQFYCQLAQGSPTRIIEGFTNVRELYNKISECFGIDERAILFCTLNTHQVDMTKLLGGQIALDDFIFAHVYGQPKEIEIPKSEESLGLTITDNGAGCAFIKKIKEGSIMDQIKHICVGDHIEKINGKNVVGSRHYEVAKMLKDIAKGETFTIRLVEPEKSTLSHIAPRNKGGSSSSKISNGKATIRLKADGTASVEDELNSHQQAAVKKIDELIESYVGVSDQELAHTLWELSQRTTNPSEFAYSVDQNFGDFNFTDEMIFDIWGAINDAKSGRLNKPDSKVEFNEQF